MFVNFKMVTRSIKTLSEKGMKLHKNIKNISKREVKVSTVLKISNHRVKTIVSDKISNTSAEFSKLNNVRISKYSTKVSKY